MVRFVVSDRFSDYWSATKRNAVSMFISMDRFGTQNHMMEMLTENNFNALLNSYRLSKINPDGDPNNVWWNYLNDHDRKWEDGWNSLFGFRLQNKWEYRLVRDVSTMLEFGTEARCPWSIGVFRWIFTFSTSIPGALHQNQHIPTWLSKWYETV